MLLTGGGGTDSYPRALRKSYQQSHSSKSGETWLRKLLIWPSKYLRSCFEVFFLHVVKSFNMGPPDLLPLQRKSCCEFVSPLEIHRPGLNPQTLGPIASTLTTIPPRTTYKGLEIGHECFFPYPFHFIIHCRICCYVTKS
jgi:hypothetical protein